MKARGKPRAKNQRTYH